MTVNIEVTDTFCGEANYCWVNRYSVELPVSASRLTVIRAVKREIGWNGIRCEVSDFGDEYHIRPYGMNQVCFITFDFG